MFGDGSLWWERVLRSARPEETEEVEEFVCTGPAAGGWIVRARDERLGDIAGSQVKRNAIRT